MTRLLSILTWHVHGGYLYHLSRIRHELVLPVKPGRPPGFCGRTPSYPWPDNVREVPAEAVRTMEFDCILFQQQQNYLVDQYEILSPAQRSLPKVYIEHDPPRQHPTDTRHVVDDPNVLLVHVTPFNALMWDSGGTPTTVIEHGVFVPEEARYRGDLPRGITVVNNLRPRGRRLGSDVFESARREVPLDLVGMDSETMGGIGEIPPPDLPLFISQYRFFFNPIRYTSLGLAVCEAMMVGLPVIALATTEMATVIRNGVSGYIDTHLRALIGPMQQLIADPGEARMLGERARQTALERFNIDRFVSDWESALALVTGTQAEHRRDVERPVLLAGNVT